MTCEKFLSSSSHKIDKQSHYRIELDITVDKVLACIFFFPFLLLSSIQEFALQNRPLMYYFLFPLLCPNKWLLLLQKTENGKRFLALLWSRVWDSKYQNKPSTVQSLNLSWFLWNQCNKCLCCRNQSALYTMPEVEVIFLCFLISHNTHQKYLICDYVIFDQPNFLDKVLFCFDCTIHSCFRVSVDNTSCNDCTLVKVICHPI